MPKIIASLALVILQFGVVLGNYWFTFGLWPSSWTAFFSFALASMILAACHVVVQRGTS